MAESLTPRPLTLAAGLFVLFSCVCLGLCEEAKNDQCPAPCPGITVLAPAGPPGPKGDMGRTGPRGRPGRCETKCAGEDGKGLTLGPLKILSGKGKPFMIGRLGQTGEKGAPGIPGPPGKKGDTGECPPTEKGSQKCLGLQGIPKGAKGDKGQAGANGMQGSPGLGVPGEKGAKGDPGVQGPPGSSGANAVGDSSKAVQGPPGTKGVTGEKGDKGNKGANGYDGGQGAPGYPGSPGPEGMQGIKGGKGALGISGTPGKPGYPGDNGQPGGKGEKGEPGRPCSSTCTGDARRPPAPQPDLPFVAFSAALVNRVLNVPENTILTYNQVMTNVGNAYDRLTGKFAPSVAGYYMFSFTGMTTSVKGSAYWSRLTKNGEPVVSVYDKSSGEHISSSNSVILLLKPGDEVWVELDKRSSMWGDYPGYVTFSGHLVHRI